MEGDMATPGGSGGGRGGGGGAGHVIAASTCAHSLPVQNKNGFASVGHREKSGVTDWRKAVDEKYDGPTNHASEVESE